MKRIINMMIISGTLCSLSAYSTIIKEDANKAYVLQDAAPHLKPSFNSPKMYVTPTRIGYLRKAETIEVLNIVKNGKTTWCETPRGFVPEKYLRYMPDEETVPEVIKEVTSDEIAIVPVNQEATIDKEHIVKDKKVQERVPEVIKEVKSDEIVIAPVNQEAITNKEQVLKEHKEMPQSKSSQSNISYFIGVGINYNSVGIKQENIVGNIILNKELDDSATSTTLQVGTRLNQYVLSANYEMLNLDDVKLNSLYLSLDYTFDYSFRPFIGLSIGMSNLEWQIDPLVNSKTEDEKLSSLMYGIQAGIDYPVYNSWSIYSLLSYQKFDLETSLTSTPAKAIVTHEDKISIGAGIRFGF